MGNSYGSAPGFCPGDPQPQICIIVKLEMSPAPMASGFKAPQTCTLKFSIEVVVNFQLKKDKISFNSANNSSSVLGQCACEVCGAGILFSAPIHTLCSQQVETLCYITNILCQKVDPFCVHILKRWSDKCYVHCESMSSRQGTRLRFRSWVYQRLSH